MNEYSILFVRTEEDQARRVEALLAEGFDGRIEWVHVEALFDGLRLLQEQAFDLILADLALPDSQGLEVLRHLNQQAPQTPVIVFCHASDRTTAVTAVRKGAHDFFCYEDLDAGNLRLSVLGALQSKAGEAESDNPADRRNNVRFPCRLSVSYQALEHPFFSGQATSETLNISSKGLLFTTAEPLQAGQLLQVSVDWPARLENQVPLKLVAEGRIVRNVNGLAAMHIEKYEFRTRRAKPPQPGAADGAKKQAVPPVSSSADKPAGAKPGRGV